MGNLLARLGVGESVVEEWVWRKRRDAPVTGERKAIAAAGQTGGVAAREGPAKTGDAAKTEDAVSTDGAAATGEPIGTWQRTSASKGS